MATMMTPVQPHSREPKYRYRAFTLLEMLVVIGVIAILFAIVLTALGKVRDTARCVACMNNMKVVAYEFFQFADDYAHTYRGDSDRYGGKTFRLEDFQEKLYRIHEFWDAGSATEQSLEPSKYPLLCPAVRETLVKREELPCNQYAVGPPENVSVGFNMRLEQVTVVRGSWAQLRRTRLSSQILEQPNVPLAFGVDGTTAVSNGVLPYYAAPPASDVGPYGTGLFWFPSPRHGGRLNVAYVGGHVMRLPNLEPRPQSVWSYQPPLK